MTITIVLALLVAYLLGSMPSAVWIGKTFYGIDVREYGSGNAGATNTFRVLGKKAGLTVLFLDVLKGFMAVMLAILVSKAPEGSRPFVNLQLVFGITAVIGHIFPVFAAFRGGKGIAALFGVVMAVHPYACLMAVGVFLLVFLSTRYVSLSSISAGIAFPIIVIAFFGGAVVPAMVAFSIMVAILILITHQKNIERLLRNQESRMNLSQKLKSNSESDEDTVSQG